MVGIAEGDFKIWHMLLAGPIEIEDRRLGMQFRVRCVHRGRRRRDVWAQILVHYVRYTLNRVGPYWTGIPLFRRITKNGIQKISPILNSQFFQNQ